VAEAGSGCIRIESSAKYFRNASRTPISPAVAENSFSVFASSSSRGETAVSAHTSTANTSTIIAARFIIAPQHTSIIAVRAKFPL
jgi:hypothetical protein